MAKTYPIVATAFAGALTVEFRGRRFSQPPQPGL